MGQIAMPRDCFLRKLEAPFSRGGKKVYRSEDGKRLFTWDSLHGHVEGYDAHGYHIGVFDQLGTWTDDAVKGRKIDV